MAAPAQTVPDSEAAIAPAEARRARRRRRIRNIVIAILAIPLIVWAVLYITKGRFLKHPFERIGGRLTNRTMRVGGAFQLYFAPLAIKFYPERLSISNPCLASRPDRFRATRAASRLSPSSSLFLQRRP